MRFIFALVANLTYTLFCASIQYVVVYLYSMIFFSSSLLLSESLVLCMIFVTLFLYVLCLFLLVIFDLENLQLSAEILQNEGQRTLLSGVVSAEVEQSADYAKDHMMGGSRAHTEKSSVFASPVANVDNDHMAFDFNNDGEDFFSNVYTDCMMSLVLCHIIVILAILTVYLITLYECMYESNRVLCSVTYGLHPANSAVGIFVLIITISVIFPIFSLYKVNVATCSVFRRQMPSLVVMYISFVTLPIIFKLNAHATACPLADIFQGDLAPIYASIVTLFTMRVLIHVGHWYYVSENKAGPQDTSALRIHISQSNSLIDIFSILCVGVLLLINLGYTWKISLIYNILQTICLFSFMLVMSLRIVYTSSVDAEKKNK